MNRNNGKTWKDIMRKLYKIIKTRIIMEKKIERENYRMIETENNMER